MTDGSVLLSSPPLQHRAHRSRFALNPRCAVLYTHSLPFPSLHFTTLFIRPRPISFTSFLYSVPLPYLIPLITPYPPINLLPLSFTPTISTSFLSFSSFHSVCLSYLLPVLHSSHHSLPPSFSLTYTLLYFLLLQFRSHETVSRAVEGRGRQSGRRDESPHVRLSRYCTVPYSALLYSTPTLLPLFECQLHLASTSIMHIISYHITSLCTAPFILSSIH